MAIPTNEALSDKLNEMADILELQHEDGYRIAAYRRAAKTLLALDRPVDAIVQRDGLEGLVALPGIGRGIGAALVEIVTTGRWAQLERLSGTLDPQSLFQTIPGIGPELAVRIHNELHVDTLEELELAAHDGRLERIPGVGARRALAIRGALTDRLGHRHFKRSVQSGAPPIALVLEVDRDYREKASAGALPRIAPKRFNPTGEAWLPVLHTRRGAGTSRCSSPIRNARTNSGRRTIGSWPTSTSLRDRKPSLRSSRRPEVRCSAGVSCVAVRAIALPIMPKRPARPHERG